MSHGFERISENEIRIIKNGKEVVYEIPSSGYPPLQDQLIALWLGGDAEQAMRAKIISMIKEKPND